MTRNTDSLHPWNERRRLKELKIQVNSSGPQAEAAIANVFTNARTNLGDRTSSPYLYFNFPPAVVKVIFARPTQRFKHLILGGGGLFWNERRVLQFLDKTVGHSVTWGAGHNSHGHKSIRWPAYMGRFSLHGIRDWNVGYHWVPCASCMHASFDRQYSPTHEVVLYEHHGFPTGISGLPRMTNNAASMDAAIAFLGSGETILTNSYHGAYWGTLLNKKVVIIDPFSTKFHFFRHQPIIATSSSWVKDRRRTEAFPEALTVCRSANRDHYDRVHDLLFI